MKKLITGGLLFMVGVMLLVGCGGNDTSGIEVRDAWVRNSPMVERAGASYMVIENSSAVEDRLLSASVDFANTVELHETKEMNGMMQMSPVEAIPVPANGSVELAPGGLHVMLIDLTSELEPGAKVILRLNFENAGEIEVEAVVKDQ